MSFLHGLQKAWSDETFELVIKENSSPYFEEYDCSRRFFLAGSGFILRESAMATQNCS